MLNECVFDHTVINEHDAAEYFKPVADSSSRYAVRRTLAEFDENALISSLREIQAPVLLLWGEDDKWHPAGEVDEYRSSLRSCSCTVIRNAGHLVHEENPTGSPNLSAASFRRDTIINIVLQKRVQNSVFEIISKSGSEQIGSGPPLFRNGSFG